MESKKVVYPNGIIFYVHPVTEEPHREDGPAIERPDGTKEYWVYGQLHREEGPAVEYNSGSREYWVRGRLHRVNGPAIRRFIGPGYRWEYWVDEKKLTKNEFYALKKASLLSKT